VSVSVTLLYLLLVWRVFRDENTVPNLREDLDEMLADRENAQDRQGRGGLHTSRCILHLSRITLISDQ
jgi:hypothetical protein